MSAPLISRISSTQGNVSKACSASDSISAILLEYSYPTNTEHAVPITSNMLTVDVLKVCLRERGLCFQQSRSERL